ncbi:MAG: GNAT family N-acetyltransferase [Candidatus Cloacimonetes bacterium]|nr:GNAT family N-acetyltransferase [Candidatus Cloacimonadota bacterium]
MIIINVWDYSPGIEAASRYIHSLWGREENYNFYHDAISHSANDENALPRFYLMMDEDKICGCYALLTNDLISRQDLLPWLACLYIEPEFRGRKLGSVLLNHGVQEADRLGYKKVYLTTDHDSYYERYGWQRMEDGFNLFGEQGRIYFYTID